MPFLTRRLIQRIQQTPILQVLNKNVKLSRQIPFMRDILMEDVNFVKVLNARKPLTLSDWKEARQELLKFDFVNKTNLDSIISNLCFTLNNKDAFTSYIQFLKKCDLEINLYLAGTYVNNLRSKFPLSESDKQEICNMYDFVRKKYPMLDGATCEHFIHAICVTDRWEESIELLDIMKFSKKINPSSLSSIIHAAFFNDKPEVGWKYLTFAVENKILLLPTAFTGYLEYCLRIFKDKELLENNLLKVFDYCREAEKIMQKSVLDDYLAIFQSLGYSYSETTISRQGRCHNCSHQLTIPKISAEEFEEMSKLFMEKVLIGDNVYYNSTPKEFKEFLLFLKQAVPYDIVIDGLNVACAGSDTSLQKKADRVAKVVEHFLSQDKKILLLGRKHMLKWKNMNFIKHNTKMFLVDNSSYDDPNLLYATLYGGIKTCFMSGDLMRQHKTLLPLKTQKLFKIWQLSHQYMLDFRRNSIIPPVKFETLVQKDKNGWHLPYFLGNGIGKDSYDSTINWVCLRKNVNKSYT